MLTTKKTLLTFCAASFAAATHLLATLICLKVSPTYLTNILLRRTPSLLGFVDVQKWHISSGEPAFLEYDQASGASDASPYRSCATTQC
jgi:hypothetical protein